MVRILYLALLSLSLTATAALAQAPSAKADAQAAKADAQAAKVDAKPPIANAKPTAAVDFNRDIRPILSNRCWKCHGPDTQSGELALHERALATRGRSSGIPAVVPKLPTSSGLYQRVTASHPDERMPPPEEKGGPLTAEQIDKLRLWIEQGAPYAEHWAFVPPAEAAPPTVKRADWVRNPIDAFVLARLEAEGLAPAPQEDRAILLRRAALALTGLPPEPRELDVFLADKRPDAFERAVDRLLESPHYGEHMASWWLDLGRYADTDGYEKDNRRTMWPWRDWVIKAFNRDLPFHQFTLEQLAGDLLPDADEDQQIATGFHRNTLVNTEGGTDDEEFRVAAVVDRVNTTMEVWMGLSFGCAQCHNHKYDPISQKDYYRVFAVFNSTADKGRSHDPILELPTPEEVVRRAQLKRRIDALKRTLDTSTRLLEANQAEWEKKIEPTHQHPDDIKQIVGLSPEKRNAAQRLRLGSYYRGICPELAEVRRELEECKKELGEIKPASVLVMKELPKPRETHVLIRGNFEAPGDKVTPGVPAKFPQLPTDAKPDRAALARWLTSSANPLGGRVLANRLWARTFGTGLVETVEDFGNQGERPSHPELLDWLARELPRQSWSLKAFQKLLVTSATFRQSSRVTAALRERDPVNRLLARGPRLRLEAEAIRDNALAISGLLDRRVGGPSVFPYQPDGVWANPYSGDRWVTSSLGDRHRRGLYTFWRRTAHYAEFAVFDAPSREVACQRRSRTNTPLQALATLNDPVFVEAAVALGRRMLTEPKSGSDALARAAWGLRLCVARAADDAELATLAKLYRDARAKFAADAAAARKLIAVLDEPARQGLDPVELAAWAVVGNVLLNLDETITRN